MKKLNIKIKVILFLLLVLLCIPEKVYSQKLNVDNLTIYIDNKKLDINDKKLTIKIKPLKNYYVKFKGGYTPTYFYCKIYKGMFEESDSLKIELYSKVKNKKNVTIVKDIYIFRHRLQQVLNDGNNNKKPSHIITFYYPQNTYKQNNNPNDPNNFVYWGRIMSEKQDSILQSERVYPDALKVYNHIFSLGNNKETKALLDTLSLLSDDANIKAFYFSIVHSIVYNTFRESNDEMKKLLVKPCMNILLSNREYVYNYLYCYNNNNFLEQYAQILGKGFYLKKKGLLDLEYNFAAFKRKMKKGKSKWMEKPLEKLFSEIERVMKDLELLNQNSDKQ
jgi:hypothetical protein